jgi:hypothetical protein
MSTEPADGAVVAPDAGEHGAVAEEKEPVKLRTDSTIDDMPAPVAVETDAERRISLTGMDDINLAEGQYFAYNLQSYPKSVVGLAC